MKTFSFRPQGVCSQEMRVTLDDNGIIQDLQVLGGCSGNLQGMSAKDAVARLKGIQCGPRPTSCPDQLARGLEQMLSQV